MKALIISLSCVLVILIGVGAYMHFGATDDERKLRQAQDNVEKYISDNANDAASYESVEWGPLKPSANTNYSYVIGHKFRAKNAFGGTVLTDAVFYLDSNMHVINAEWNR